MQKTRMLLGVTLALGIAGTSAAAERTRGSNDRDQVRSSDSVVAEPTIEGFRMVAPDTGEVELNGQTVQANVDGSIVLQDILDVHGDLYGYQKAMVLSTVVVAPGSQGEVVAANGMVLYDRDFLGGTAPDSLPVRSIDEYKQLMGYATSMMNGTEVTAFADGAVMVAQDANAPITLVNRSIPSLIGLDGSAVAADGAVIP